MLTLYIVCVCLLKLVMAALEKLRGSDQCAFTSHGSEAGGAAPGRPAEGDVCGPDRSKVSGGPRPKPLWCSKSNDIFSASGIVILGQPR